MKFLALITVLMSSAMAYAYPALNDQAVYSGTYVQGTQSFPVTLTLELVQYDASRHAYLKRTTIAASNGQSQMQEEWVNESDMITPAQVHEILATCSQQGGHLENIQVGTESIASCALPQSDENENSIYWIADVPFGIVKGDMTDRKAGSHTILTMQSHR